MTVRDTAWPDGTPCWADLMVPDPRMAMDFYGALFGWDFTDLGDEAGNYLMCSVDGRTVAGIGGIPPEQDVPAVWTTYLATSDVDRTTGAVTEAGGSLIVPPMDVMTAGRMAVASDPAGAAFGLWQARDTIGARLTNVPSAMLWNECMVRDFETAREFYAAVFGYEFDDMSDDQYTYATMLRDGRVVGGLGLLPPEVPADVPPHWMTYFGVADTDSAVDQVSRLGGSTISDPSDTPYGRYCMVADNQGVSFALLSVTAEPELAGA
ncbi:VOC family protein [Saccharomonospora saliphila]|uniref:VOC family protein n=1 Tax=Saccharomonospora saliphila TaxID=369829 RepID=UPI00037EA349|nr:VOC family protein [Saccharomonospora saliphila]